jgi:DNA-binding beta-propeller fold protein YncE/tetratricopeptide (TPR) repeat protein
MAQIRRAGLLLVFFLIGATHVFAYQQIEFVRETGRNGAQSAPKFDEPRALAAFGDRLYIADTGNHRIVVTDRTGKALLSWGTKGSKPGQFKSPSGIAVDDLGRVYVADTGNSRVQVFNSEGRLLRAYGGDGDEPREFSSPTGIAVSQGLVYVADSDNSRIQVLTSDGIFLSQITVKVGKEKMEYPVGVAVDAQNRVYVLDKDADKVRVFDSSGTEVAEFGSRGEGASGFDKPQGVAVDRRGNIYVADTGNYKIKKFDARGRLLASFGAEGDGPGQFQKVTGLIVDDEGRLLAVDADKNTIQTFATELDGTPLLAKASPPPTVEFLKKIAGQVTTVAINKRAWGITGDTLLALGIYGGRTISGRGGDPGFMEDARGLAADNHGDFWVADTGNNRLEEFSLEGNLLTVLGKSGSHEGEFDTPSAVAISPKGNICVADTGNYRVQIFSPKGVFLGSFGKEGAGPGRFKEIVDIATDAAENLYVVDRSNDRIGKYDSTGNLIWEAGKKGDGPGEFQKPENIVVSPDDEIYVLDSENARVQVFSTAGKFLRMFGSRGSDAGQFKSPEGLALEDGLRLFVGDRGNARVQVFLLKHTPAIPAGLEAKAQANEIQLSWKENRESYLDQYRVYRADAPAGPFSLIGSSNTPFYFDKHLQSNRTFYYQVSSQAREGNESAPTVVVSAVTPKLVPAAPKRVTTEAREKQITLSWLPNLEPFMKNYRVYRTDNLASGFTFLADTDKTIFMDGPLPDETIYYYQVTAVGKEGDESPPSEVVFAATPKAALTAPTLDITKIEIGEIFASEYKHYEAHPLGKVMVTNNGDKTYSKVKLSFSIKDFMDYPTEIEIEEIAPKQSIELQLKPVFNNKILEVTENTPLQSELGLTYYEAGEPKTVTRTFPLTLYERHAMRWDQKTKLGAFVTHKDPVVADFSRLVVGQYVDVYPNLPQSIVYARGVYDALGVLGLKYIVDPTSPFAEFSENAQAADYIQYPRDTLARKSGDCDDLSVLFAACMENIGVGAAFVDVPGHVFVMINTGVPEKDKVSLGFPDELLVSYQGTVWLPVEMTVVGTSFTKAWQKGAEEYRDWSSQKKTDVVVVRKAWEEFMPVTLPNSNASVKVKRDEIEAAYKDELETLGRQRLTFLSAEYRERLKRDPNDVGAMAQLGILYGENGLYSEALEQFQKMLALNKTDSLALNNIGNISYLQGRLDDARQAYEAALQASPAEPGIMANLARVFMQTGKKDEAKKLLLDAASIDPRVLRKYPDLTEGLDVK